MIKAVLFDMDGTVLDTIDDLRDSLNHVLSKYSFPGHSLEKVKHFVGNGLHKLMERAVPDGTPADLVDEMYICFIRYYNAHCHIKTKPYPGISELIAALKEKGIRTAVISNKSDAAVNELAVQFFDGCFETAIGALDGVKLKPDREMVDIALQRLGLDAGDAIYVGDSQVDIDTARNAHMECISVTWGFRDREELIEHGALKLADTPGEVLQYITDGNVEESSITNK